MASPVAFRRLKIRRDRVGVHAFDRATGLNLLVDEVAVPEREWAAAPRHLAVALTNACDLHCPFCYANKHRAALDPARVLGWLREADAAGCLGVGFGGGEPTTVRGFAELCRAVANETALAVSFTTHGHRLSEDLLSQLAGSVHMVRVSIDGVGKTYERLRGRPFDALVDRLNMLRHVAPFGVNVVVNDHTIGELDAVAELGARVGAAELLLLPELRFGAGTGATARTLAALRAWVDAYNGEVRLAISQEGADGLPVAEPFRSQPLIERYAHIDADGVLRRSSFAAGGVAIGERTFLATYQLLAGEEAE
ncbi:radical SAM protein [Patulibacter minatonensis]|uniref:radical SAM protein n=1 Tax=Patulibacter minatonensis TaxID=298163 RepID=UPI00068486B1|nr:radical SAM protein [Patulibacter minatonensis]